MFGRFYWTCYHSQESSQMLKEFTRQKWYSVTHMTHMTVIADTAALYLIKGLTLSSLCEFWDHTTTICLSPGFLGYYGSGDLCDRILINWSSLHNFPPKVHWILITKRNFPPLARRETRCQGTIIHVRQDQECHVSDDVHLPWIITTKESECTRKPIEMENPSA